ncbi:MAG: hypothetical protein KF754_15420 [Planctomycetes bacterium]|nr:hypothetical protein [Planctomycetota bacterium]
MRRFALLVLAVVALGQIAVSPAIAQESAPDTKGARINKGAAIEPGNLVVALVNPKGNTLDVYDPVQKKVVRNIATFPAGVGIDHVVLSPDRKRVAFTSQLNNFMSLYAWNVFVIELETGALNQITPDQATGTGLAKPYTAQGRGTIKGKLAWLHPQGGKSHQFTSGNVRLDGLEVFGLVKGDGSFVIENVPCMEPISTYFLFAHVMLPMSANYENKLAQGSMTTTLTPGGTTDVGELMVKPPRVDLGFAYPSWGKEGLYVSGLGLGYTQYTPYPKVEKKGWEKSLTDWMFLDPSGVMASPDGKYLAGADKWSNNDVQNFQISRCIVFFDNKGKRHRRVDLGSPDVLHVYSNNNGAWLPDSSAVIVPGSYTSYDLNAPIIMAPCLFYAKPGGEYGILKSWPQAAGKGQITSLTADAKGEVIYLVFTQLVDQGVIGNLWAWNRKTDETTQLTDSNNVQSIGSYGR